MKSSRLSLLAVLIAASIGPAHAISLWTSKQTPRNPTVEDPQAVELGTRVCFEQPGTITGVRYFKGPRNTGTHVGSIWSADGQRLASVAFDPVGETASGTWREAALPAPVRITPGTEYVVSYFAPNGFYSADNEYFTLRPRVSTPVVAYGDDAFSVNGVYRYGPNGGFPNQTYRGSNYWTDVVFSPDSPPSVWVGAATIFGSCLSPPDYAGDDAPVELGVRFGVATPGRVNSVTFHRAPGRGFSPGNPLSYEVRIWNEDTGQELARGLARISQNPTDGKMTGILDRTVTVQPGVRYIASYHAPNGGYAISRGSLGNDGDRFFGVGAPVSTVFEGGVYAYGGPGTLPTNSYQQSHYWVDVRFFPDAQ